MKLIKPEHWTPSDGILLEKEAVRAVKSNQHVLVVAGPGAGKTELLAQKAAYLFQTNLCRKPRKILAISFKIDAAQNLKERIDKRCGKDIGSRFISMTYDAFAKSIIDHFRCALPNYMRPDKDYCVNDLDVIDAAFRKAGFCNPNDLSKNKLLQYYENVLLSAEISTNSTKLGPIVWCYLLKGFDGNRSTLSFKMIARLAYYIISNNPKIRKAIQCTYSHVFLDEFQDTTSLQYSLVMSCFKNSATKITAVGDNKQRIMLWAGAMPNVFRVFWDDWKPEGIRLIMNHRSAPRLVALQKNMYESLKEEKKEVECSGKWNEDDGEISLFITTNEDHEAKMVVHDILERINHGIKPNDICIICKQLPENYSSVIINELQCNGIRARIETKYQDLIKEPIISLTIDILSCSLNRKQPQKWEHIESTIMELWNVEPFEKNASYEQYQRKIFDGIDSIRRLVFQSDVCVSGVIEAIWEYLGINHIKAYFPIYRHGGYLDELKTRFLELLTQEFTFSQNKWKLTIENFVGFHSIPIMTIHKSKGLEYDSVYFLGLEDSAFWNFRNQPEEDRCAFFVALSRAKRSVTFTFCKHRSQLKYPEQSHNRINEFYVLLQKPGIARIIEQ